jgi:hypothetical protein
MTYEVEVWWLSPKTAKLEMVFARDLDKDTQDRLIHKIFNYGDWSELKSYIEKHEDRPVSYICKGARTERSKYSVELSVK